MGSDENKAYKLGDIIYIEHEDAPHGLIEGIITGVYGPIPPNPDIPEYITETISYDFKMTNYIHIGHFQQLGSEYEPYFYLNGKGGSCRHEAILAVGDPKVVRLLYGKN